MSLMISVLNQSIWSSQDAAFEYERLSGPFPSEEWVVENYAIELEQASLLDVGIGSGRTTAFLQPLCKDYKGIDYSPTMIERAQVNNPNANIKLGDARNLSAFSDNSFNVVWFSYNGIDYLSHADRIEALKEFHRVLKPGGLLIFSAHNRDSYSPPAHHFGHIKWSFNIKRTLGSILRYAGGVVRSIKLKPSTLHTEQYEIRNDPAQGYRLLTYYISLASQVAQLSDLGLNIETCIGEHGETLQKDTVYSQGYSITYIARAI